MIVLLISLAEAKSLCEPRRPNPDKALRSYIASAMAMERLLPDDNLPDAVLLRQLALDGSGRNYVAVMREYTTPTAADLAWDDRNE